MNWDHAPGRITAAENERAFILAMVAGCINSDPDSVEDQDQPKQGITVQLPLNRLFAPSSLITYPGCLRCHAVRFMHFKIFETLLGSTIAIHFRAGQGRLRRLFVRFG